MSTPLSTTTATAPLNVQPLDVFHCPLQDTLLIEASAGTGKTWNICGLVLRLLLERGLKVQQVLVVTFTKAATAELRERIRARLNDLLAGLRGGLPDDAFVQGLLARLRSRPEHDEAETMLRLHEAVQGFDEAAIFTIHGFCQRALGEAAFTAGVPLQLEAQTDDRALRLQVVQDFWRRHLAVPQLPAPLTRLMAQLNDSPERWAALLKRQLGQPLATVLWPAELDRADHTDEAALQAAHSAARALWQGQREGIEATLRAGLPALNGNTYNAKAVATALQAWHTLLAPATPDMALPEKAELLGSAKLVLSTKKKQTTPAHAFFDAAQALLDAHHHSRDSAVLARLHLLRQLLQTAPEGLRQAKAQARVVAFDDMLFNLHDRLQGPQGDALAAQLRERFPAALIDEFQDTDPLQYAVFQRLYGGAPALADGRPAGPLCLVGDPKQAIYSFRGADLHTYLQARGAASAHYTLAQNQRSMPALLQGLNALFGRHPRAFLQPGLDYPPVSAGSKPKPPLVEAADAPARQALHLWALPGGTVAPEGANAPPAPLPTKAQAQAAAAQACAAEIARLLAAGQAGQCTLGGRPLQGGDIAVLVRSHRQGSLMRQALTDLGVASVELSQDSVFDSPDADALLRLLMALLQPGQEAVLRAALATELMGWTADRLLQLDADENTLLAVVLQFQQWHSLWQQRGIARWLRQWLEEAQVASRLLQRPDGERRLTNLLHLGEVLQAAAAEHHSPEALLRWFQGQRGREGGGSEEAQLRLESDRHLVQVVTIHKSKGLEYAIVFCPFLWDGGRLQPSSGGDGLAYHDDEGRAVIDFHPTPQVADAAQRLALAAAAEQLRLLYVALTRAVHRCHVVVGGHGRGKRLDSSAKAWLNWLVAGGAFDSAAQWLAPGPTLAQVVAAWQALADSTPEAIALEPLPLAPGQPLPAQRPAAASLQALPAPSRMSQPWWVGSYSGLVQSRGAKAEHPHQRAAADHDALVPTAASPGAAASVPSTSALAEATAQLPPDDILAFPRGATAGQCLHRLFELADFAQPTQWPSAVQQALAEQPPEDGRSPRRQRPEQLQAAMLQMLQDVLHSPLPVLPATGTPHTRDTFTLAEVPAGQRLAELEFHLPSSRLSDRGLVALLAPYGYRLPALDFGTLKGYLRGFIDLVFQHQGRWYILDWKSNHLGGSALHYGAAPLQAAMDEHAYTLQYLLYTVALHRWLQTRLPGYRYEEHMGGVLYLFVRGVRPGWRQADGPWAGHTAGMVADRPPLACIEALAALLQPAPATPFTAKPAEPAHPGDR